MPQMTLASWATWATAIILQPFLAWRIYRNGWLRAWPSLFAYAFFKSFFSFYMLALILGLPDTDQRAAAYFYSFYAGNLLSTGIEIWIIFAIANEIAGPICRPLVAYFFPLSAAFFVVLGVSTSFAAPMNPFGRFVTVAVDVAKGVHLAWLMTFLAWCLLGEIFGVKLRGAAVWISVGFAAQTCLETSESWLSSAYPSNWVHISETKSFLYCTVLCIWAHAFRLQRAEQESGPSLVRLSRWVSHHTLAVERLRKKP